MATTSPAAVFQGRVKQVLSGDTIVILGPIKAGKQAERTLSLAGVTGRKLERVTISDNCVYTLVDSAFL